MFSTTGKANFDFCCAGLDLLPVSEKRCAFSCLVCRRILSEHQLDGTPWVELTTFRPVVLEIVCWLRYTRSDCVQFVEELHDV